LLQLLTTGYGTKRRLGNVRFFAPLMGAKRTRFLQHKEGLPVTCRAASKKSPAPVREAQ